MARRAWILAAYGLPPNRLLAMAVILLCCRSAHANDATATLAAGGLVLQKTADIEMRSENLYVSEHAVRVEYVFRNTSAQDVTTLVAFPLPDIPNVGLRYAYSLPTENDLATSQDPANFLAFHTHVDGKPVRTQVEQRVVVAGIDRTAWLTERSISLNADVDWDKVAVADRDQLVAWQMLDCKGGCSARWPLKTTYYWQQVFPAGRDIHVKHAYVPSRGNCNLEDCDGPSKPTGRKRYCVDDKGAAAYQKLIQFTPPKKHADRYEDHFQRVIEYVLETGSYWKAPIADFRITIDKGQRRNLMFACGQFEKVSPTRYEMRRKDFLPSGNLRILMVHPSERTR